MNRLWLKPILVLTIMAAIAVPAIPVREQTMSSAEGDHGSKHASIGKTRMLCGNESCGIRRDMDDCDTPGACEGQRKNASAVYDPELTLGVQIGRLEDLADRGDPYATCVLAWALDMCMSNRSPVDPEDFLGSRDEDLDENEIAAAERKIEYRRKVERACADVNAGSFPQFSTRLLESAKRGSVRSMTRFAYAQGEFGQSDDKIDASLSNEYRENAESMLNRAADAGDPEAILGVYHAYSSGYLESRFGKLLVDMDMVKAAAAARVLSFYGTDEVKEDLRDFIGGAESRMSGPELSRLRTQESRFRQAYWHRASAGPIHATDLDTLPETACARMSAARGGAMAERIGRASGP